MSVDKEGVITFWKLSSSGSESRNFKDYSALRDRTFFHNLADISGKKTVRIFMTILPCTYLWTRKSTLNFSSHPDSDMDYESGTDSPCRRSAIPERFCFIIDVA